MFSQSETQKLIVKPGEFAISSTAMLVSRYELGGVILIIQNLKNGLAVLANFTSEVGSLSNKSRILESLHFILGYIAESPDNVFSLDISEHTIYIIDA